MTFHKQYKTISNVKLVIEVKEVAGNKKPFYGTYSVLVNDVSAGKRGFARQSLINQGDVYASVEEAVAIILKKSKEFLPVELQEEWLEVTET